MDKKKARNPEIEELSDQIGEFIRYWGFKKVHGRIWAHVFLAEEALDAAAIIDALGISKALASMSINDLLEHRVILPQGKSARGTQLYVANPDLMEPILNVLRTRERKLLSRIEGSFRQVKKSAAEGRRIAGVDPAKLKQLGELIESAEDVLDAFLDFKQIDLSVWCRFANEPPKP